MADVIDKPAPTTEDEIERDDLRIMEEHAKKDGNKEKIGTSKVGADKKGKEETEEFPTEGISEDEENLIEEEIPANEEVADEEHLLDEVNARGLDFKKIKEKHPDFFKSQEFRQLRDSYYREGKYTELFPTIEDAQEAAENHETFLKMNSEIIEKGSMQGLLTAIKEANPDSLKKVSLSFLDSLNKVEPSLYVQAVSPVVKNLTRSIYANGKKILSRDSESTEGKALVATARNLAMWAFDDPDIVEKSDEPRENPELSKKEKELEEREQKIAQQNYERAFRTAMSNMTRKLDEQILTGLNVDNEFLRDSLLEKIKLEVDKQITSDQSHMKRMASLWKQAESSGYDNRSLSRIISAYLERARPIIPIVRNRLRSLAMGKKVASDKEESVRVPRGTSGKPAHGDGKINMKLVDPKKIDYSQTSDEDILNGRIKMRQ